MGIAKRFAERFNARDLDGLVALFTADGSYVDGFWGRYDGHAGLREMFVRMFREGRDYVWDMERTLDDGRLAMAEWSFRYVVTDAIPRSAGRAVHFRGMSVFELAADGRIAAYREYFDSGPALLQLGFAPESLAKVLRRKLPAG